MKFIGINNSVYITYINDSLCIYYKGLWTKMHKILINDPLKNEKWFWNNFEKWSSDTGYKIVQFMAYYKQNVLTCCLKSLKLKYWYVQFHIYQSFKCLSEYWAYLSKSLHAKLCKCKQMIESSKVFHKRKIINTESF